MKKKNKFKYETKEDGTRTFAKQPIWMHSIDKPLDKAEVRDTYLSLLLVAIVLGMLIFIWKVLCNGE